MGFDFINFLSGDLICARIASDLVTMQENVPMWLSATTVVFLGKDLLSLPHQSVFHTVSITLFLIICGSFLLFWFLSFLYHPLYLAQIRWSEFNL